jgi:hypothetical protein
MQWIEAALAMLEQMRLGLDDKEKKNFQIKTHNVIPTNSIIIVDGDTDSGYMQVEHYPFHISHFNTIIYCLKREMNQDNFSFVENELNERENEPSTSY